LVECPAADPSDLRDRDDECRS